jgi:peptide/nickel transport system substrate-binding protein
MVIEPVDVSVWFDRFVNGDYQITSAYQERTVDPDNFYALVLRSGGLINTTAYSNPEFDALVDEARTSTDTEARKELYRQIREMVAQDAPIVFAHYETINYLMKNNVCGSTVNPTLELRLELVSFCEWWRGVCRDAAGPSLAGRRSSSAGLSASFRASGCGGPGLGAWALRVLSSGLSG